MIVNEYATAEYWNRAYGEGRTCRDVTSLEIDLFQALVRTEPGMVAVEIGCGLGDWARAFASVGLSVTGYDLSSVAVAEAAKLTDELRGDCSSTPSSPTAGPTWWPSTQTRCQCSP